MADLSDSSPLIDQFAEPVARLPRLPTVVTLFETIAQANPNAIALSIGSDRLNYGELNRRANRLARKLLQSNVAKGEIIGVCLDRSFELYVGLLAILKAGAAYLPIDREYPDERLGLMLRAAEVKTVLVHQATLNRVGSLGIANVLINVDDHVSSLESDRDLESNPALSLSSDDLAYVMFTSGSSGIPKGVLVPHRGIVRLIHQTNYCEFGPDQVFLQFAPISFDASTFEIWGPLLSGGRLAITPPGFAGLSELASLIHCEGVTTLWLTASLFHLMIDQYPEALSGLRQLIAGGDVLSPSHVRKALATLENGVVINGYGPTETTAFACCYRMSTPEQVGQTVPIGMPICWTALHVLDDNLAPVTVGQPGELWIGGDGVALGYLGDAELNSRKFLSDPFSKSPNARIYRTGDRVRKRNDGVYEFIGRIDEQLKIHGYRIEPSEIEIALLDHPKVCQAAVTAPQDSRGEKRLVGYFVSEATVDDIKSHLADLLPSHMVPNILIRLDTMPLTPNGKVDRDALPDPNHDRRDPIGDPLVIEGSIDTTIASIWERVLDVKVKPDDNFFDLGGDSLLLIEVHAELQKAFGREIPIMSLFEHTTTRTLSEYLANTGGLQSGIQEALDRATQQREALSRRRSRH